MNLFDFKSIRSQSGSSTIIGGVIVIAMAFTIIVPLFFFMNSMDNIYDAVATEMRDLDQQRSWEAIDTITCLTTSGDIYIDITNNGPLSVNITRIWVVPSNPEYSVKSFTPEGPWDWYLKPGDHLGITSTKPYPPNSINSYISTLVSSSYYIKVVTTRGEISTAPFEVPREEAEFYPFPLYIMASSVIWGKGSDWRMILHLYNQHDHDYTIDFTVITSQYTEAGKPKSRIATRDLDIIIPPRKIFVSNIIDFNAPPTTDVILVELVGSDGNILGVHYFFL